MSGLVQVQGRIQDSRKEGARPSRSAKIPKLMILMTHLINVCSNVLVAVVEKTGFSVFTSYMCIENA